MVVVNIYRNCLNRWQGMQGTAAPSLQHAIVHLVLTPPSPYLPDTTQITQLLRYIHILKNIQINRGNNITNQSLYTQAYQ